MNKNIKLIWQFSGRDALKVADHHLIHLKEYINRENLIVISTGTEFLNEFSAISFIVIDNSFLKKIRLELKPHRGFLVK